MWNKWKYGKFVDLVTTNLETTSQLLLKKVHKVSREVKDKNWEVCESIKLRIDQFKRTMPLIQDLKNDAMRDRHWSQIKTEIQKPLDHESSSFTLEKIIGLGLDQFSEQISEISAAASKELSIEQVLKDIAAMWEDLKLDISPYKDRGHFKLKATDEIFQTLEDNQVLLIRFYRPGGLVLARMSFLQMRSEIRSEMRSEIVGKPLVGGLKQFNNVINTPSIVFD